MKLFLGMFTYGGVYPRTVECLVAECCLQIANIAKTCSNDKFYFRSFSGDADFSRCRATATEAFLETDADVFVMIDRDIIWPWQSNIFMDMAKFALDNMALVGPVVTQKTLGPYFSGRALTPIDVFDEDNYGKFFEVEYIGGAVMVVPRKIIEDVRETVPKATSNNFVPIYAPFVREDGLYLADDWAFSERAKQFGYKNYMKLYKGISHTGDYNFSFDSRFEDIFEEVKESGD